MKIKRFVLFTYDEHYPGGGWNDFKESFDTIVEAKKVIQKQGDGFCYKNESYNYYDLIDLKTGESIYLYREWPNGFEANDLTQLIPKT